MAMVTEIIPTKFPVQDVKEMDALVKKGVFISRSDLIRNAAREKMREVKSPNEFEHAVRVMAAKGDFSSLEGRTLASLFLNPEKQGFNPAEKKAISKLLRHPFKILKKIGKKIALTDNGQSVARGYLKGLAFAETLA
jgi:Arc/MetJ-type ribon-helix-helix transcriptional regulator